MYMYVAACSRARSCGVMISASYHFIQAKKVYWQHHAWHADDRKHARHLMDVFGTWYRGHRQYGTTVHVQSAYEYS